MSIVCPDKPCARCGEAQRDISCYCYPCHNRNGRESKQRNGGNRNYHLIRRYGITAEEADDLLDNQGGVCAVCLRIANQDLKKPWHVDHERGIIRGILCHHCNTGLGNLRDDPDILKRAIEYLIGGE